MIVEIFIAQAQPISTLRDQLRDTVLMKRDFRKSMKQDANREMNC